MDGMLSPPVLDANVPARPERAVHRISSRHWRAFWSPVSRSRRGVAAALLAAAVGRRRLRAPMPFHLVRILGTHTAGFDLAAINRAGGGFASIPPSCKGEYHA